MLLAQWLWRICLPDCQASVGRLFFNAVLVCLSDKEKPGRAGLKSVSTAARAAVRFRRG